MKTNPVLLLAERLKDGPWFMEHMMDERGIQFLIVWDKQTFVEEIGRIFGCVTFDCMVRKMRDHGFVLIEEAGDIRFITPNMDVPQKRKRKADAPPEDRPVKKQTPRSIEITSEHSAFVAPSTDLLAAKVAVLETQVQALVYQVTLIQAALLAGRVPLPPAPI